MSAAATASSASTARPHGRTWLAWLAAVFVVALVPRLVYTARFEQEHPQAQRLGIDEESYDGWARTLADGDWLGDEVFFQEPLYAYALGVVYSVAGPEPSDQRALARRVQAVLGALTAVLVALLGARAFSRAAGLVAGFALALYRPAIWMGALLLKPALVLPVLTLLALALLGTRGAEVRPRAAQLARWLGVGLLAGLGALLRGNLLVLAPAFVAWPLVRALAQRRAVTRELTAAAAVLLGLVLTLGPVALRNRAIGGRLVLTTTGAGTNVYAGNNPLNPFGLATELPWVRGIPEHEADDWRHEAERRLGHPLDPGEVSRYWLGQALESARREPLTHLSILWNRLRLTLGAYEVPDNHFLEWDARHVGFLRLPLPGFALWGSLGLAGLLALGWQALRRRPSVSGEALEVAVLILLYLGTIVLTITSERTRLALVPLLLPFAGAWLVAWRRPRVEAGLRLGSLALAAALVLWPALAESKRRDDLDERDFNLAVALLHEPTDLDGAAELARALGERHPTDPRVLVLGAQVDYRMARRWLDADPPDTARAEPLILQALERLERAGGSDKPRERFQADALAGAVLQYLGRWGAAEERYRSALRFDPADRDLRRRLAVVVAERAVGAADVTTRNAGLDEALALVAALRAERDETELERLEAKLRAASDG